MYTKEADSGTSVMNTLMALLYTYNTATREYTHLFIHGADNNHSLTKATPINFESSRSIFEEIREKNIN